jgi:hypothetical protein
MVLQPLWTLECRTFKMSLLCVDVGRSGTESSRVSAEAGLVVQSTHCQQVLPAVPSLIWCMAVLLVDTRSDHIP